MTRLHSLLLRNKSAFSRKTQTRLRLQKRFRILLLIVVAVSSSTLSAENKLLDDLFLGVWSPFTSKWQASIPICVWTDTNDSLYQVTATGQRPGSKFQISNDIGDLVSYNVFWHFGNKLNQREKLSSGNTSRKNFTFAENRQCNSGANAQVRVVLNKKQIADAPPGIYNDTLLFMFSPI